MLKHIAQQSLLFLVAGCFSSAVQAHAGHGMHSETASGFLNVVSGADHIFLFTLSGMAAAFHVGSKKLVGLLTVAAVLVAGLWGDSHLQVIANVPVAGLFVLEFMLMSAALWGLGCYGAKAIQQNIAEAAERKKSKGGISIL